MHFLMRALSGITVCAIAAAVGVPALPPDCNNNGIDDIAETATIFAERLVETAGYHDVSAADLDGDGDRDLLAATGSSIIWFPNLDGVGAFGPAITIGSGDPSMLVTHAEVIDVDGDDDPDVLVTTLSRILWYPNDGAGGFGAPVMIDPETDMATAAAAGDVDGDGDRDVVATITGSDLIFLYRNLGEGVFGLRSLITTEVGNATPPVLADLDADGDLDLLVAAYTGSDVLWFRNDGSGLFGPVQTIPSFLALPTEVIAADLNGDSLLDVIVSAKDDKFVWFPATAAGVFGAQIHLFTTASGVEFIEAADLDGDGDLDLVAQEYDFARTTWVRNTDGLGSFSLGGELFTGHYPGSLAIADVDGDGDLDPIVASTTPGGGTLAYLENLGDDCNGNQQPDECDVAQGADDCNGNLIPDICDQAAGNSRDCNTNDVLDECDLSQGTSQDCDGDGTPNECEPDCNGNGQADDCDIIAGTSADCDADGKPDECEPDCNGNAQADDCDISGGTSDDCDGDGTPDECQPDCNSNGQSDACDITEGSSVDCDGNGVPDSCDVSQGPDCNANGIPDVCDAEVRFEKHALAAGAAAAIVTADVDGDLDRDVVSVFQASGIVGWYENLDGAGTFAPIQIVKTLAGVEGLHMADADADGDPDLFIGSVTIDRLEWLVNLGQGNFAPAVTIDGNADVRSIRTPDLDGDGDLDVLWAARNENQVLWSENLDGLDVFGSPQVIYDALNVTNGAYAVGAADVDGDDDLDVLAGAGFYGPWWHENLGGGNFGEATGTGQSHPASMITPEDLDGDGDVDMLIGGAAHVLGWFENRDGQGSFGVTRVIAEVDVNWDVRAADINGDGALDPVAALGDDGLAWYESRDGADSFEMRVIDDQITGARALWVDDLNRDGLVDVIYSGKDAVEIAWYERLPGDCNGNEVPDSCEIASGEAIDCDLDGIIDSCQADCNGNGTGDLCDIAEGLSLDCDADGIPDECEPDCDLNGIADDCDAAAGFDCNDNGIPDSCDIASSESDDCTADGTPDECQPDCDANDVADVCDVLAGTSGDCDDDGLLDQCEPWFPQFAAFPVSSEALIARHGVTGDIDGDGDIDVVSAAWLGNQIAWYENLDGAGTFGSQRAISNLASGGQSVDVVDVDGDDDLDVLSASATNDLIAWYENLDGAGSFGPQIVISFAADFARRVRAADIDGDGDADVLSASENDNEIAWYENLDGLGGFGPQQIVSNSAMGANGVFAADLDGDDDLDLLSASYADDRIAWYENLDGDGSFGSAQLISSAEDGALDVLAGDLDGDGDLDVVSVAGIGGRVVWYENLDGAGQFHAGRMISDQDEGARHVDLVDLDRDGASDVLVTADVLGSVFWYRNLGDGQSWERWTIGPLSVPYSAVDGDIDGDGEPDIVTVSAGDGTVTWFRNPGFDCNFDGIPNFCETDCDDNGYPDSCAIDQGLAPDCNGNARPDICDVGCVETCDIDGDGCADAVDSDPLDPTQCADVDGDGCQDCSSGNFDPLADGADADLDGHCDPGDCAPSDDSLWSEPGSSSELRLVRQPTTLSLTWTAPSAPGGASLRYDLLRSDLADDFVSPATECVESDGTDTAGVEPIPSGALLFYLIRAENDCPGGQGNMGNDSDEIPRQGRACP